MSVNLSNLQTEVLWGPGDLTGGIEVYFACRVGLGGTRPGRKSISPA